MGKHGTTGNWNNLWTRKRQTAMQNIIRRIEHGWSCSKLLQNEVDHLHSDSGGEYKNVLVEFHSQTTMDTVHKNPFSEMINRKLVEKVPLVLLVLVLSFLPMDFAGDKTVWCAPQKAGLDAKYFDYEIRNVVCVKTWIVHSSLNCNPYEILKGNKTTLKYVKVSGCSAFANDEKLASNFHTTAQHEIFLGCIENKMYTIERLRDKRTDTSVQVNVCGNQFVYLEKKSNFLVMIMKTV